MENTHDLRITDVKAVELRGVKFGQGLLTPWSRSVHTTRDYLVVQISTDAGISGITMDGDYTLGTGAKVVNEIVAPYLVGRPVCDFHEHTRFLQAGRRHGRLFFIEIALWDILGQAMGLPLYRLWGGARDRIKAYASTVHWGKSPHERSEDCLAYLERGYRAVKLRLSYDTAAEDIAFVAKVREAVGDRMEILVDANQAGAKPGEARTWTLRRAIDTARALHDLGVGWLEEPLPYALEDDGVTLTETVEIPTAGGEGQVGLEAFRHLVERRVYDVVQPDPVVSGTASTLLKVGALCEAAGRPVAYHHGKSGVGMMTALHLSAAIPHAPYLEYMDDPGFWNPDGFQVGFKSLVPLDEEGCVRCPSLPGLGIEWDETWLAAHGLGEKRPPAP